MRGASTQESLNVFVWGCIFSILSTKVGNDFERKMTINCHRYEPYNHSTCFGYIAVNFCIPNDNFKRSKNIGFDPTSMKEFHREEELMVKFFFVNNTDSHQREVFSRYGRYKQ